MNWYEVTTEGRVAKFDVTKTDKRYIRTTCTWTKDTLLAALANRAEQEGVTDLRIVKFSEVTEPYASWGVEVFDLDKYLGI